MLSRQGRTNCLYGGQWLILQEHEVARLDITVQNFVGMTLGNGPQHCPHVTGHLQVLDVKVLNHHPGFETTFPWEMQVA